MSPQVHGHVNMTGTCRKTKLLDLDVAVLAFYKCSKSRLAAGAVNRPYEVRVYHLLPTGLYADRTATGHTYTPWRALPLTLPYTLCHWHTQAFSQQAEQSKASLDLRSAVHSLALFPHNKVETCLRAGLTFIFPVLCLARASGVFVIGPVRVYIVAEVSVFRTPNSSQTYNCQIARILVPSPTNCCGFL